MLIVKAKNNADFISDVDYYVVRNLLSKLDLKIITAIKYLK